ncbi:phosphatase PAP2 family protein [Fervidibacillus albus]|uniref:Phosphatase PAP2 family protein n=1 Tax=Fervidibacillus albus TaxID=2980026 RepID=A0A9E8LWL8_9BACI|nr:phosphatase PAP2 family protein [Fervidibacillus albus]WAA10924.1 phosphatase PAP2 family protein [Fervidibacillus albus]
MGITELLYEWECKLFRAINRQYEHKWVYAIFRTVTQLASAPFSIGIVLLLILNSTGNVKTAAITAGISLAISHIPVQIGKKIFRRKRPYLVFNQIFVTNRPLKDLSFPSGHTTAAFSVITPFVIFYPFSSFILVPLGMIIGLSRIVLGLHYPSDCFAGMLLGIVFGLLSVYFMNNYDSLLLNH